LVHSYAHRVITWKGNSVKIRNCFRSCKLTSSWQVNKFES